MTDDYEGARCMLCELHGRERCALHGPPPSAAPWLRAQTPRTRGASARQLDVFAGRDVRGKARQLDLFGASTAVPQPAEEAPYGAQ